jgi:L-histidine Nalpha-methyltransferase
MERGLHHRTLIRGDRMAPDRFSLLTTSTDAQRAAFARDVRMGLLARPKRLSCRYFYDGEGSRLFEQICALPEYYLTRAESEILREHAHAIVEACDAPVSLVELGSGTALKTRWIIEALLQRQKNVRYVPIDIDRGALENSSRRLLGEYPGLSITALVAEYQEGLRRLPERDGSRLFLWLGSSVGNLHRPDAAAFLTDVRRCMTMADRLLVGMDLRKERRVLEAAYDDAQGVTARFNLNLLQRINRELGGHFNLASFRHRAVYEQQLGRIEIYLDSLREQQVRIDRLELEVPFAAGEAIHTENSYKYSFEEIDELAAAAGLYVQEQWLDHHQRFSTNLLAVDPRA